MGGGRVSLSARSVEANALGLDPRLVAVLTDFEFAAVAEHTRRPSSKRNDAGGSPAGSAIDLPGSVKVARRFVKPLVLVRVQAWQPF